MTSPSLKQLSLPTLRKGATAHVMGLGAALAMSTLGAQLQAQTLTPGAQVEVDRTIARSQVALDGQDRASDLGGTRSAGSVGAQPSDSSPIDAPQGADGIRFELKQIVFNESRVFSQAQLDAFVAPYEGRRIPVSDLFVLTNRINAAYRDLGYVTTQAILVPQDIVGGRVQIQLVEGQIGDVLVSGNTGVGSKFVARDVESIRGTVPTVAKLENAVSGINWNRPYRVGLALQPGTQPQTTDLDLQVRSEPKPLSGSFYIDNHGGDTTGKFTFGLNASAYSMFGAGERLTFGVTTSQPSGDKFLNNFHLNSAFLSLDAPLPIPNGSISVLYSKSNTGVISGDFEPLGISGKGEIWRVGTSLPIYSSPNANISFVASAERASTLSTVGIVDTETATNRFSLGMNGRQSFVEQGIYMAGGLRVTQARVHEQGLAGDIKTRVVRVNYDLSLQKQWSSGLGLTISGGGQSSSGTRLPTAEQFYVGGVSTLPGFEQSAFGGDHGYFGNVELNYTPNFSKNTESNKGIVTTFKGFVGFAGIFDDVVEPDDREKFWNVGIGVSTRARNSFFDLVAAWPIDLDGHQNFAKTGPHLLVRVGMNF